ncbi:MAG: helix-turn-helix domain-containing protein [bacterium]|nr:helix-turn-helix domain-containing protein [bacterium]
MIRTRIIIISFISCFLCLLMSQMRLFALKVQHSADEYIINRLTTKNGLPQNTIYDITQDQDGYIWIGTDQGVVRYDGINFLQYNNANTKAIKNNSITALCAASDGTLWIGTFGGGVVIYKDKTFTGFSTRNGLSNDFIWVITEDKQHHIWLGTVGGGLMRFKNNRFDTFTVTDGLSDNIINALVQDRKGNLWIGTEKGLNRLMDSKIETYAREEGIANNNIMSVFEDSRGVLWVGTLNGLTAKKGNKTATFTTKEGLSNNMIRSIFEDRRNNIWVATDDGLNRLVRKTSLEMKITPFLSGEGDTNNSLIRIFEDREGNLWVGSTGDGLTILHHRKLLNYTMKDGLSRDYTKAVLQDTNGAMWIGTNGGGLNRIGKTNITVFTREHGLGSNFVNSILQDKNANLWCGTAKGLNLYKNDTFTLFTRKDGLSSDSIRIVYEDSSGTLWIGTYGGGLNRFDKKENKFSALTTNNGLSDNFILSMAEDKEKNLWIGTNKGLNRFKDNHFETFTREHGLSDDMIYDVYPDSEGALWLGTNGGGLNRFKDGKFSSFTTEKGLFNNVIYRVIEDNKGNLWMSSNKGIFTVSKRELNAMARGVRSYLSCKYFDEGDGMKSSVCTGGFQPAGSKMKNGLLWFPTIKGIVILDPATINYNSVAPPVFIERVVVDAVSRSKKALLELPADSNEIKIQFTALCYTAPAKIRFRYSLSVNGYEGKWVETHSRARVIYSQLPAGRYQFKVKACNNDGVWNTKGAAVSFTLVPPFHGTFWFYLFIAALVTAAGFGISILFGKKSIEEIEDEQKYQASGLTKPKSRMLLRKVQKYMKQEKPYLDSEMSAAKLAEGLGISQKVLSQIVNQQLNKNFKNFLNEYRVEEAKVKLLDPKEQDFVLLKIALDVGFNSKSVFNDAFKKFTGMSPTQYKKKAAAKKEPKA